MNRIISILLIIGYSQLLCASNVTGVIIHCEALDSSNNNYLLNTADEGPYHVQLRFYNQSTPIPGLTVSKIDSALMKLDSLFQGSNIFFEWDCVIHSKESIPSVNSAIAVQLITTGNNTTNNIPGSKVNVNHEQILSPVFAHELGHALGLLHTHEGAFCSAQGGVNGIDLADGSICDIAGDCLCDTHPAPEFNNLIGTATYDYVTCQYDTTLMTSFNEHCFQDSTGQTYWPVDDTNIMSYAGDCRAGPFTDDQINRMKNFLSNHSSLANIQSSSPGDFDLVVTNTGGTNAETWDNTSHPSGKIISRDLIIDNDSELEISGTANDPFKLIFKSSGGKILIRNGAFLDMEHIEISTCESESFQWEGIVLESSGELKLDESTIENCETGIRQEGGNSPIEVTNTTFKDMDKGIAFVGHDHPETSKVINCIFQNMDQGITSYFNQRVVIHGCSFSDISEDGVYGINSSFDINSSGSKKTTFSNVTYGVTLQQTYQPVKGGTRIMNCTFDCTVQGIYAQGAATIIPIIVMNNSFLGEGVNCFWSGANSFEVSQNSFSGATVSNLLFSPGFNDTNYEANKINSEAYGVWAIYDNQATQLITNCFVGNDESHILVSGDLADQGTIDESNTNCFEQQNPDFTISGNSTALVYYNPDSIGYSPADCEIVDSMSKLIIEEAFLEKPYDNCDYPQYVYGSSASDSIIIIHDPCLLAYEDNYCVCDPSLGCFPIDSVEFVEGARTSVENDTTITSIQKSSLLSAYSRLLNNLLLKQVEYLIDASEVDSAIQLLLVDTLFENKTRAYSILLEENRLTEADSILGTIDAATTEQQNFISTQYFYLDYLSNPEEFELDEEETEDLASYADDTTSLSAFSRSLWALLFDEVLMPSLPSLGEGYEIEERSQSLLIGNGVKVYPNPFMDYLYIEIDTELLYDRVKYDIFDSKGNKIKTGGLIESKSQIKINDFYPGIYFIRIHSSDEILLESYQIVKI